MKKIHGLCAFVLFASSLAIGCATAATAVPAVSQLDRGDSVPESVLVEAIFVRERLAAGNSAVAPRGVIRLTGSSLPKDLARLDVANAGCPATGNTLELVNKTKFVLTVSVDGTAIKFLDAAGIVGYLSAGQTACVRLDQAPAKHEVKVTAHLVSNDEAIELISVKQQQTTVAEDKVFPLVIDYARLLTR